MGFSAFRLVAAALVATLALGVSKAQADGHGYRLGFENTCWQPVDVALRYIHDNGEWRTRGWYTLQPGDKSFVGTTTNRIFYYFAESEGANWSGDDKYYKVRDDAVPYGFRERRVDLDNYGEWVTKLRCEDPDVYFVQIINECSDKLDVALRFKDPDTDEWRTRGYFNVDRYERQKIQSTNNTIIYIHASRGSKYYTGDDMREYNVRGNSERFFRKDMSETGPSIRFLC